MEFTSDFAAAQQFVSASLISITRAATQIAAEDIAFHRSSDAAVARSLDRQNARLLSFAERLLRSAASTSRTRLPDIESVDSNWAGVVDTVDSLLERSDTCLDEYNGRFRQQSSQQPAEVFPDISNAAVSKLRGQSPALRTRAPHKSQSFRIDNIPKPQLLFDHRPVNNETNPFRPLLTSKPYAVIPFEQSLVIDENEDGSRQYQHPYQTEIDRYQYPSSAYTKTEATPYLPFEDTTACFVDTYEGVLEMLDELRDATEIAIDLEHHDTHSYIGIVSLMQISTRTGDWIIDTLKPWRRKLEILNQVFANPNILKVLHGAQMDIIWLQRDLGLYVVGLFDTHHASRVLGYTAGSLAFLLKKFVDFDAQKQYQTADWRMRPLPPEMFNYARSDTHFLLYIYDLIRNDLVDRSEFDQPDEDRVQAVLEKSKATALQRYENSVYDEDQGIGRGGWFNLLQTHSTPLSKEQFTVFRKVHQWRDKVARQEDENAHAIIPNHVLFNIARALPRDSPALLSVSHPISQVLRLRTSEVLRVIREAVAESTEGPEMADKMMQVLQSNPALARKTRPIISSTTGSLTYGEATSRSSAMGLANPDIRLIESTFWGKTLTADHGHLASIALTSHAAVGSRLTLPLLHHAVGGVASIVGAAHNGKAMATASIEDDQIQPTHCPTIMPATPGAGKRKIDLVDNYAGGTADSSDNRLQPYAPASDSEGDDPDEALRKKQKAAEKAQKRTAKLAQKALQDADNGMDGRVHDQANAASKESSRPFDYDTAPSILHPSKTHSVPMGTRAPFNPFAKSADGPGGLKRSQEVRAGKSTTFKH